MRDTAIRVLRALFAGGLARILLLSLGILAITLVLAARFVYSPALSGDQLAITQVEKLAASGQVTTATVAVEDGYVTGVYCPSTPKAGGCPGGSRDYSAAYDRSSGTQAIVDSLGRNLNVTVDPQSFKAAVRFLIQFVLPVLILANLFGLIFLARSGQGSISDIVGFGRISRRRREDLVAATTVTFADVAGADEAVAELREVRDYLRDPGRYSAMAALPPKGVLLLGPPGCGKTLLARAVAGESEVPFFSISGAEFVESLVGVGAARVRDLFRQAQQYAPAIIFIDELDAAARRRNPGGGTGGTDEREQTLNQMLVAMDGFDVTSGVVVMAATNRPDIIDPALLRPGRFDRHVTVDEPDLAGRREILALHVRNRPLDADVDLDYLAQRTPGFTGADLANVANEAALLAVRDGDTRVRMSHLNEAVQRVIAGPQRRGHLMSQEERERVAYHESGHAVVAAALGMGEQLHRLSIVARGRGLGQTQVAAPGADRLVLTRGDLLNQVAIAMGGRAAEELRYAEASTAAETDIEHATELARQMIGRHGMSTVLGPVRLLHHDANVYLEGEGSGMATVSPATLQEFDVEVRATVDAARRRALQLLEERRLTLDGLVSRLLEVETLEGAELTRLLGGPTAANGVARPRARRRPTPAG